MQKDKTIIAFFVSLVLLIPIALFAQGGGGGSTGSGSGGGGDNQTQDRDRLQDGTGENCVGDADCDGVPDQDRLQTQDRDRLQDGTGDGVPDQIQDRDQQRDHSLNIGIEPLLDREQLRDRLRTQLVDPDQDKDRDRIRANDSAGLREVIIVSEEVRDDVVNQLSAELREQMRNRSRVEVGVMAFMAAQNMVGPSGEEIVSAAQNIGSSTQAAVRAEEQIQNRSRLTRFFLGGDTDAAELIKNQVQNNEQRLRQIRQQLDDCECTEEVRLILQEQLQNMLQEQDRLREVADAEEKTWGLFSWRF